LIANLACIFLLNMGFPVMEQPHAGYCSYSETKFKNQVCVGYDSSVKNSTDNVPRLKHGETMASIQNNKQANAPNSCGLTSVAISSTQSSICDGDSVTISAAPVGSTTVKYTWSLGNQTSSSIRVGPADTTKYVITVNDTVGGCSVSDSLTINVIPLPVVTAVVSSAIICSGSSSTLTANGATSYSWSNGANSSSITVSPTSNTTYTLTGTANGCNSAPRPITITVNTTPTITVSASPGTMCSGSSSTLTASGAASYIWSNGATTSSITVSPGSTTTYTVNDTTNGCGGAPQSITVTVNPTPTITISPSSTTICSGTSATLTSSGGSSYIWSTGETTSSITVSPGSTTTYTVTGTSLGCNGPPQTVTVTVNTTPTITASATPTTICSGSSTTLTATGATSYTWSNGATTSSITVSPGGTTTYAVTGTTSGCVSAPQNVTLMVNPTPTISVLATPATICAGSSSTLTASGATGYVWSNGAITSATTVTPLGTTTYTVIGSTNGCSSAPQTVTVTVNPNPTVTVAASPTVICSGSSSTLTANGANSYVWSTGATTSSVSVSPSTTATYTVTGTTNGCTDPQTVTVTVNPTPTMTLSPSPTTICPGYSSTITATGANTYVWSPSTGLNSTTGSPVIASLTSSVTYTVTGTIGTCVSTQTVTVNVSNILSMTATASPSVICSGQSSNLTAGGAVSYTWTPGNSLNTTSGPNVVATPTVTTTYTIVGVSGTCVGLQTVTVNVNPTPTVTITPSPVTMCSGSSTTLTATGAAGYVWNTGATTSSITVSPTSSTTYSVIGSTCSNTGTQTVNVTVHPTPIVTLSASATTICSVTSATLTASGATSYSWNTGATTSSISVSPGSTTTYTVTGTSLACSSVPQFITITVNPTPTVSVSASPAAICSGTSTTITASGGISYLWSTGATTSSITVSPASSKTYTVTGTAGTCSQQQTVVVSVTPTPTVSISASASTICSGSSSTLTASGAANYIWSTGATTSSISVSPATTTTYTVTGTTGTCTGTPQTITITVNPTPTVTVSASATTICSGTSTTLTASGATTYSWSNGSTASSITVSPGSTKTYTVTGSAGGCSSAPQTITITVNPTPNVTASAVPASICSGSSSTLTASGAANYTWSTGATTSSISVTPGATTTYTVTGSSAAGCSEQKTITVTVDPTPTVAVSATAGTICSGSSSTLTASGATSYSWSTGATTSSITVSPGSTTTYTVMGTTCSNTDTKTITIVVNPTPTVIISAGPGTICSGSSTTLTASGATNYTWSTGATTSTITVSPGGTTTYTVSGSAGGCTDPSTTVTVTVDPTPTVTVVAIPTAICSGSSSTLTASGATTYVWSTGETSNSITVSPGSTTTYTVTGTTGACSQIQTITLLVDPTPTVNVTASPPVICSGGSSVLTATGGTTYYWSTGATTSSITVSPIVTTTYTVNGIMCNDSTPESVTVVVITTPTVTIAAAPPTICSGSSSTLTASGAIAYVWNTGATTSAITVSPATTTTYTVSDTTGGCGGAKQTITLTVNTTPTITVTAYAYSICSGSTDTLTAHGSSGYSWNTGVTGDSIIVSPLVTTTYTVTDTVMGCGSLPQTVTITVNPTPTITVSASPSTICQGSSSTLTASGASSYTWSTGDMTNPITVTPAVTTTYSVTGATCGNSTPDTVVVTVTPTPIVTITATADTICSGSNDTLTAHGAMHYTWSTGETTSSIIVSPLSTTTYTVNDTTSGCGGAAQTFVVTVNPTPTVTITALPSTICPGSSSVLTASGATTYTWNTTETSSAITVTPLINTTYTVTGVTGGCSQVQTVTINVTPTPTVTILASPAAICSGSSSTLTAKGATNYTWSTGETTSSITVSPLTATTYTVNDTTSGCGGAPQTIAIGVTTTPTVLVTAADTIICSGSSTVLKVTGADAYTWSTGETTSSITVSPTVTTTYTVTDSTAACSGAPQTITITVNPTPTITAIATPAMICSGTSSTLVASGGTNYTWNTGATTDSITVSPTNTTTYTVYDTASGCGSVPQTVTLTVTTTPTLSLSASPTTICPGSSSILTAIGATKYTWAPDSDLSADTGAMVTATLITSLTYTVTGMNGTCKDTASITIHVGTLLGLTATASPTVICSGQSSTLKASGATSYSWSPSVGLSSASDTVVTATPTVTTTYTLIGTNGTCLGFQTTTITVNPTPIITIAQTNPLCNGDVTGKLASTVGNGTPPYSYSWSTTPVQTDSAVSGLAAGIYTLTVIDTKGCMATSIDSIIQPSVLRDSIASQNNVACFGGSNGIATVGVAGGTSAYAYSWNTTPVQTSASATALGIGAYTVTVTDAHGCKDTVSTTITQPTAIAPVLTAVSALCSDSNGGVITAGTNGGTPGYTFLWSNGLTASNLSAKVGSYTVTITDADGCIATASATINQPPAITATLTATPALCDDSNGSVSITANGGGTPGYMYSWSTGSTATTITAKAGIYILTITDANGCKDTVSGKINQPAPITPILTATVALCNDSNGGITTAGTSGGTPGYTYLWSTGSTASSIVAKSGTYSVTITDANGCMDTASKNIGQPTPIAPVLTATAALCNDSNGGITTTGTSGGTPGYTYLWSNGVTGSSIAAKAGGYSVTITDANGCKDTASNTIQQPKPIIPVLTVTAALCNDSSGGINTTGTSGGTPGYTYLWSNGVTASNITAKAGNYSVTITDANGCIDTSYAIIKQPTQIAPVLTSTAALCNDSNGGITTAGTSGGTPAYTYLWSNGVTASNITAKAGSYSVTITDANGCIDTSSAIIKQPTPIAPVLTSIGALCNDSTGGITTTGTNGGTPVYTYLWSNGVTASNVVAKAGSYTVTITDANGCIDTASALIKQPTPIAPVLTSTAALCNDSNGGITTTGTSGGTPGYAYLWSNGSTASNITAKAGSYTVTLTDANGCKDTASTSITQPNPIVPLLTSTAALCNDSNGGISVTGISGGTPGYTYMWSSGVTTSAIIAKAGSYTVTVTDGHGCKDTASKTISQPTPIIPILVSTAALCNDSTGGINTTGTSGGTPGYTYLWSSGSTASGIVAKAGAYTVTITDANGCKDTASKTIGQPTPIVPLLTATAALCNDGNGGITTAGTNGGTPGYTYLWSNTSTTSSIIAKAGMYTVTITDANGCNMNDSATITQPSHLRDSVIFIANEKCFGDSVGSIIIGSTNGTPGYTYSWAPYGGTNGTAIKLIAGIYTVTVTDAAGCELIDMDTITQPTKLTLSAAAFPASCYKECNGQLVCIPSGGTKPYSYSWNNAFATPSVLNMCAGTYSITVTDYNNCKVDTGGLIITQPLPISGVITTDTAHCGQADGGACIKSIAGGTPGYTFLWNTGDSSACIKNLLPVQYYVMVTDAYKCKDTITVTVPNAVGDTAIITATTYVTCYGGNDGTATGMGKLGVPPYRYEWNTSPKQTVQTATGLAAGQYTLTVTDSVGCHSSNIANIPQHALVVPAVGAGQAVCIGQSATLSVSAAGGTPGYTYLWMPDSLTGPSVSVSPDSTTTYTIITSDAYNCASAPVTITVAVNPPISINVSPNRSVCAGGNVTFVASASGGDGIYTYNWIPTTGLNIDTGNTVISTPVVNTQYTVSVKDGCGTPAVYDSVKAVVNPLPNVKFGVNKLDGCTPLCVSFSDSSNILSSGLSSWLWTFGDSGTSTQENPNYCYDSAGIFSIELIVKSDSGCIDSLLKPDMITAYSHPIAAFTTSLQATNIISPTINFKNESTDAYGIKSWLWQFEGSTDSSTTVENPIYTYSDTGTFCTLLTVTNIHGCTDTVSHCVVINPYFTLYIPNAFSPNGDGLNDIFTAKGTDICGFEMYIFDRWGMMLYYTQDINYGWDGTVNGSTNVAQEDTYVYLINAIDCVQHNKHKYVGKVTIIK